MRVAVVLKTFPPDVVGGMETQTKRMAAELHESGHNVTVFTKRFGEHVDSDVPYEVVRVRNWRFNPVISDLTFLVFAIAGLLRRRDEFDLLQCMMIYPVGFLGYVVGRLVGLPYFAWVRGGDYYLMNNVWWKRWMMRRVLSDTLVLVQSKEIRGDIVSDFEDVDCDVEVVGNAVSVPSERASGKDVLYVGRLAPKKGVGYLVRAVEGIDVPLVVVGDGPERDRLESLADERAVDAAFVGEVPPDEVGEYYRSSAVFVLPSTSGEGMPNVVLEAMAWGLPVVATDSGGTPSVIDDRTNGYLVPTRDEAALKDRIERLLGDEVKRMEMGEAARRYVRNQHSWERLVDELGAVYERVVG